ncbi:MAG: hypothetical protein IID31_06885 [Planctomycetes bacterium]|nr:hypothetical protein [Planctomycetota bacterium]
MLFWSVVRRGGSLWAVQGILRNVGGANPMPDPSGRSIARWYEIVIGDTGGFTLAQWGDIDSEAIYQIADLEAYDPSISVN